MFLRRLYQFVYGLLAVVPVAEHQAGQHHHVVLLKELYAFEYRLKLLALVPRVHHRLLERLDAKQHLEQADLAEPRDKLLVAHDMVWPRLYPEVGLQALLLHQVAVFVVSLAVPQEVVVADEERLYPEILLEVLYLLDYLPCRLAAPAVAPAERLGAEGAFVAAAARERRHDALGAYDVDGVKRAIHRDAVVCGHRERVEVFYERTRLGADYL